MGFLLEDEVFEKIPMEILGELQNSHSEVASSWGRPLNPGGSTLWPSLLPVTLTGMSSKAWNLPLASDLSLAFQVFIMCYSSPALFADNALSTFLGTNIQRDARVIVPALKRNLQSRERGD